MLLTLGGDLCGVCALAKTHNMSVSIGVVEKGVDRGSHTLYCSSVYINQEGEIANVHR